MAVDLRDTLNAATVALNRGGITHALIGGLALAAHGVFRATIDIDLLVAGNQRAQALNELTAEGFKLINESPEVAQFGGRGQLDLLFAQRPLTMEMLRSARPLRDFPLPVVAVEGVIGLKIQAYCNDRRRELQDKADILALMRSCPGLNFTQVEDYARLFGETQTLKDLWNQR